MAPLSIREISALVARLPATQRAALAWTPAALDRETEPLRQGLLTNDVVVECTRGVFRVFGELLPSLVQTLGAENFFAEVEGGYADALRRLQVVLPDAGSKRSADWVVHAIQGFTKFVSHLPVEEMEGLDAKSTQERGFVDFLGSEPAGVFRAAVLLMAAISIADQGGDAERAAELCDLAFLNAAEGVDHLARAGILIASDVEGDAGSRGREILQAVEEARALLTADDVNALSQARLRDLR